MRYFIFLLLSASFLFSCGHADISHYRSYPNVLTVAKKLDSDYKVYGSSSVYFTLAKKPKGWFVVRMDSKTIKPQSEELYWSASSQTYEKIPRDFFNSTESTGEISRVLDQVRNNEYNFTHSIYFGYEGWNDDVISDLGGASNLNDSLLESLARAYGTKCTDLTRPDNEDAVKRSSEMSDAQVQDFCKYGKKDLETYQKLLELNPDYETLVGKVKTKLSNENMFLWSELKEAGKDKEADQFLVDGLYDDLILDFAKNMLNSAKKDAIIFTAGDNDTYPLWYVQFKLGVRKDVAVMNTSLMNIPNWLYYWKKNYGFELQFPENFYRNSKADVVFFDRNNNSQNLSGLGKLKDGLENNDPAYKYEMSGENSPYSPTTHYRLSYAEYDSLAPVVNLKTSYLFKSDIAIMDIIAANFGKRPIYYGQTSVYGPLTDAMNRNLSFTGLLAEVVPEENHGDLYMDKYYDAEAFYTNMLTTYNCGLTNLKRLEVEQIGTNYIIDFHDLSNLLLEKGDTVRAMNAAMSSLSKVDFSIFPDPVGPYLIGDDLCHGGKLEEGHKLLKMSLEKIAALYPKQNSKDELGRYSAILSSISTDVDRFGFGEMASQVSALKKSIDEKMSRMPDTLEMNL